MIEKDSQRNIPEQAGQHWHATLRKLVIRDKILRARFFSGPYVLGRLTHFNAIAHP
jgi:hypothetical protein